jgi:hypothetical protein
MQLFAIVALLPAALAINAAEDAGAPQSPPTYTDTSGLSTTINTSASASYPATTPSEGPYPGSPMSMSVPHPIINGTVASGGAGGGYSTSSSYPTSAPGNLSTTAKQPSSSVVIATVTGSGGSVSTQTSVQVVGGSAGAPAASAPAASTGSTQSGEGGKIQDGAAAALAIFGGFLALMF